MADKFRRAWRVIGRGLRLMGLSARMDGLWLLRDTKMALIGIAADTIARLSTAAGVFLIALRFEGIGGLTGDEVLFMQGYLTAATGLYTILASGNNGHVSRIIGRGQLDHLMMQPLSLKMQLLTSGFCPFTSGGGFVVGVTVLTIAACRLPLRVTPLWLLALAGSLLVTLATIVAMQYLFSSFTFYAPVAAEEITSDVFGYLEGIGAYPLSGMPRWLQLPLSAAMPAGMMAWFPMLLLTGKLPPAAALLPLMILLALASLAGRLFTKGLRYYGYKGINRYVPFGFRM